MNGRLGIRKTVLGALVFIAAALVALGGGRDAGAVEMYPLPDQKSGGHFMESCENGGGTFVISDFNTHCFKGNNEIVCDLNGADCVTNVPPASVGSPDDPRAPTGTNPVVVVDPAPPAGPATGGRGPVESLGTDVPGTIVATDDDPGTVVLPAGGSGSSVPTDAETIALVDTDDEP